LIQIHNSNQCGRFNGGGGEPPDPTLGTPVTTNNPTGEKYTH